MRWLSTFEHHFLSFCFSIAAKQLCLRLIHIKTEIMVPHFQIIVLTRKSNCSCTVTSRKCLLFALVRRTIYVEVMRGAGWNFIADNLTSLYDTWLRSCSVVPFQVGRIGFMWCFDDFRPYYNVLANATTLLVVFVKKLHLWSLKGNLRRDVFKMS